MIVKCIACGRTTPNVKTTKGYAPCCGTFRSTFRVLKKYIAVSKKKKEARA